MLGMSVGIVDMFKAKVNRLSFVASSSVASFQGHPQILSQSCGEKHCCKIKCGSGLGMKLPLLYLCPVGNPQFLSHLSPQAFLVTCVFSGDILWPF